MTGHRRGRAGDVRSDAMLDDGVKQTGGELRVADVAVLLAEALERV